MDPHSGHSDNAVCFRVELELSFRLVRVVDRDLLRWGGKQVAPVAHLVVEEEQEGENQSRKKEKNAKKCRTKDGRGFTFKRKVDTPANGPSQRERHVDRCHLLTEPDPVVGLAAAAGADPAEGEAGEDGEEK